MRLLPSLIRRSNAPLSSFRSAVTILEQHKGTKATHLRQRRFHARQAASPARSNSKSREPEQQSCMSTGG